MILFQPTKVEIRTVQTGVVQTQRDPGPTKENVEFQLALDLWIFSKGEVPECC